MDMKLRIVEYEKSRVVFLSTLTQIALYVIDLAWNMASRFSGAVSIKKLKNISQYN